MFGLSGSVKWIWPRSVRPLRLLRRKWVGQEFPRCRRYEYQYTESI